MAMTFDYKNLPNELKAMVWVEAASTKGVHHFRLTPHDPSSWGQLLNVEPAHPAKKDPSTWIIRHEMGGLDLDGASFYGVRKWARDTPLWVAPFKQNQRRGPTHNNRAKVDIAQDIVFIHVSPSYTRFFQLDWLANCERFSRLETIAVDFLQAAGWGRCTCGFHDDRVKWRICPYEVASFACIFAGSLRRFYFVYPLTGNRVRNGDYRNPRGEWFTARRSAAVIINEVATEVSAAGGEVWRDKDSVYYEIIKDEHLDLLVDGHQLRRNIEQIGRMWEDGHRVRGGYTPARNNATIRVLLRVLRPRAITED